jgi:hypothetical protein
MTKIVLVRTKQTNKHSSKNVRSYDTIDSNILNVENLKFQQPVLGGVKDVSLTIPYLS